MTNAAEIVRTGRQGAGFSQSELARRARVPQSSISRIEAGERSPSIELIDRLLAPAHQHVSVLPTRTPTVAEAAAAIRHLIESGDEPYVFRALIQVANDLADAEPALRVALVVTPPAPTGDRGVDAFLAAVVEYRLVGEGLPCPAWVQEPQRAVEPEWVASGLAQLADLTRAGTPESFRRRGVLIHEADLVSY
jgi:transcriptional regulator with XRE-family HTH domain